MKNNILHDDYLVPAKEGDYMSVRRLVLKGTNEEIGFALGSIAKNEYGTRLAPYADVLYAQARMEYFERNWHGMAERMKGVCRAFDIDPYHATCDASELLYDVPFGGMGCSAVFFPGSITESGHPLVVRNYDYYNLTFSETMSKAPQAGEHRMNDRSVVTEMHPADGGYATLSISGMNLLNPFLDVINEKGLYITGLMDPDAPAAPGALTGRYVSGLSIFQLSQMVTAKCATVAEAKKELLQHHLAETFKGLHWLIADTQGNATVFEVDAVAGFVFTDAQRDKPLVVTNYHLFTHPEYKDFPELEMSLEHNPYVRRRLLDETIKNHTGKYTRNDIAHIIDTVLCAFVDNAKAGVLGGLSERTLWSLTADLAEKNMEARFYLGDGEPVAGTNHLNIRRTEPVRILFEER